MFKIEHKLEYCHRESRGCYTLGLIRREIDVRRRGKGGKSVGVVFGGVFSKHHATLRAHHLLQREIPRRIDGSVRILCIRGGATYGRKAAKPGKVEMHSWHLMPFVSLAELNRRIKGMHSAQPRVASSHVLKTPVAAHTDRIHKTMPTRPESFARRRTDRC